MRVFVTGGTGLLGNTIIRQLLDAGDEVVALVRSEPDSDVFGGLELEFFRSELVPEPVGEEGNDSASDAMAEVIAGCDAVIHSAAMIHLGWTRMEDSYAVNRDGTRRIARACLNANRRMVLVGTVNTLALGSPQMIADETTPLSHAGGQVECAYVKSKRASVAEVKAAVQEGLNAAIVHPGFMLGPWDWKPSSGRMMLEIAKGWKPLSPSGGCSLCDSRDVAAAVIAATKVDCESGREFIAAGHNWTYQHLWTEMARRMGKRPPLRSAGPGMQFLAGMFGDGWTKLSGKEVDVNSAGVQMSAQFHWYDSKRACDELGYQIRGAEETLDIAGEWIRERFILPTTTRDR